MTWLLFPLVLAIVIFVGVQVVTGHWPSPTPARDAKILAYWEKHRRHGFLHFVLCGPVPAVLVYAVAAALTRTWLASVPRSTAQFFHIFVWTAVLSVPAAFLITWAHRARVSAEAREAQSRQPPREKIQTSTVAGH